MRQRGGLSAAMSLEVDRLAGLGGELAAAEPVPSAGDQVDHRHAAVGPAAQALVVGGVEAADLVREVAVGVVDVEVGADLRRSQGPGVMTSSRSMDPFATSRSASGLPSASFRRYAGRRRGPEPHRDRPGRRRPARELDGRPEPILDVEEVERARLVGVAAGDLEPAVLDRDLRRVAVESRLKR